MAEKFNQTDTFRRWLMGHLRRISYRYGPRYRVKRAANKGRGQYKCAACEEIFGPKEIQLDHVKPVIDIKKGFVDWDTFINRLFVDEEGYQVLCRTCHQEKSVGENKERAKPEKKSSKPDRDKVQRASKKKKPKVGAKRK